MRRLHPLAILFPFNCYSRPPRLGRTFRIPRSAALALIFVVILVIDYYSLSVSVRDDGAVLVQHDGFTWETWSILFLGIGIVAACLIVRWWTFRWWIADDALWTRGGVFNTWQRRVAFGQIVTVDRSSTPVRRVFKASRLAIETTAVDQAAPDVLFGYLSNKNANLLEDLLIGTLVFAGENTAARQFNPLSVDQLGWRDLLLAGATTFQFGRAVVLLYAAALFLLAQFSPTLVFRFDVSDFGRPSVQFVVAPLAGIVVALWLVSTAYFVGSFARFRLGKHEGWLIIESGIIRRSRRLIKIEAIQGLEISRSPLQRYFRSKRAMLRMRLLAYGAPTIYAMVLHPAVSDVSISTLAHQIVGMNLATSAAMCGKGVQPLAAESRRRYVTYWPMRVVAGSAVLLALLLVLRPQLWWWAAVPLVLVVPLALTGWLAWRGAGWYAGSGDWLLLQRGALTLTSTAARIDRIQFVSWSQGPLSRATTTRSFAVSVATSGGVGWFDRISALLWRRASPSLIQIRAVDAVNAEMIAAASGCLQSLPSESISRSWRFGNQRAAGNGGR